MKIWNKFFLLLIISFSLISSVIAGTLKEDLDSVVNQAITETRVVGTVILVYQDGKEIYRSVSGYRDRENDVLMTEDTIFRFASLSKAITSVAVMKLVDQGKINLEDPVTKWLPNFTPHLVGGKTPEITIRHLLTHTSGLSSQFLEGKNGPYHQLNISDGIDTIRISLAENIRRLALAPLVIAPGTFWNYSLSTDVLGAVIATASGKSLPEVVDELVLLPLGMAHTGFILKDNPRLVSVPYIDDKNEPVKMIEGQELSFGLSGVTFSPSRIFDKTAFPSGGGSMSGTAGDYVKFLESIRLGTIGLKKTSLIQLTTNQIGDLVVYGKPGWGWSLGFSVLKDPVVGTTPQTKGTYQWGGIWGHAWWVDPENKLTVVIMTNTTEGGLVGRRFANEFRDALYAHLN